MVKWQDINKQVMNSIAFVGSIGVLIMISLLAGFDVSYTNWEDCIDGTDCYARFEMNTSYWRVCFNIDDTVEIPQFFKKQSRSRTLWVNTSRYGFVATEPDIPTKLMFGTYKSRGIEQAPDGKWLRDVKTGDCIERLKTNYLYVKGVKEKNQEIKWSADLFDIDPVWLPIGEKDLNLTKTIQWYESSVIGTGTAPSKENLTGDFYRPLIADYITEEGSGWSAVNVHNGKTAFVKVLATEEEHTNIEKVNGIKRFSYLTEQELEFKGKQYEESFKLYDISVGDSTRPTHPSGSWKDHFNRSNGIIAGASNSSGNWSGSTRFEIVSEQVKKMSINNAWIFANSSAAPYAEDTYAQARMVTLDNANGRWVGPCVRYQSTSANYCGTYWHPNSPYQWRIIRGTNILATYNEDAVHGTIKVQVNGTNIEVWDNGVSKISTSDGNVTGVGYTGFFDDYNANGVWDDFEADSIDVAPPAGVDNCTQLQTNNGVINEGTFAFSTECDITPNTLRQNGGSLFINPSGILIANGCAIAETARHAVSEDGKKICNE